MEETPTTRLDAVNLCLEVIGEQPVNVIPTSGVTEATIANRVVNRISREIQARELHCNTEYDYPLAVSNLGEFVIPSNVIRVDPMDGTRNVVQRGQKLYDKDNHTYKFEETTMKVEIVWFLPFEDLPEHVRHYVAVRSARVFQRNYLGSDTINQLTMEDEQRAMVNFERGEGKTDDRTFLDTSTPATIIRRRF